jgi:hypothetical protein
MGMSVEGITRFGLNQFSKRYMLHILARFTSYVNVLMGNPSHFEEYVDRKRQGNTYDIEHILPDKYEDYKDGFADLEDFESTRNLIGNLILLTRDKNRSYQAMKYSEKVQKYAGDNILAQALVVRHTRKTRVFFRQSLPNMASEIFPISIGRALLTELRFI